MDLTRCELVEIFREWETRRRVTPSEFPALPDEDVAVVAGRSADYFVEMLEVVRRESTNVGVTDDEDLARVAETKPSAGAPPAALLEWRRELVIDLEKAVASVAAGAPLGLDVVAFVEENSSLILTIDRRLRLLARRSNV